MPHSLIRSFTLSLFHSFILSFLHSLIYSKLIQRIVTLVSTHQIRLVAKGKLCNVTSLRRSIGLVIGRTTITHIFCSYSINFEKALFPSLKLHSCTQKLGKPSFLYLRSFSQLHSRIQIHSTSPSICASAKFCFFYSSSPFTF